MSAKTINWGIIGAGKIAEKFARDLQDLKDTKIVAIASRSESKADKFALKFNIPIAYAGYEKLVKDDNIDAVYIATPHSYHCKHSKLGLEHKKAVLCEKPLALNANQVEGMQRCAQTNNVLLMEAMWTAFLPHYKYVKSILDSKKLGELLHLTADFGFFTPFDTTSRLFNKATGGGSLLDIGIYPVFLALSTLGEPESIEAEAKFFENGTDAECEMLFKYGKKTARLKSTFLKNTKNEAFFECECGTIRIHSRFHEPTAVTVIDKEKKKTYMDFKDNRLGYCYEIEHFNDLLRSGKTESPVMSFKVSQDLIRHLDIIRSKIGLEY